jgi:hypothetical protein
VAFHTYKDKSDGNRSPVPGSARTQPSYRAVLSSVTCGPKRGSKYLSFHYDLLDHYMDRGGVYM